MSGIYRKVARTGDIAGGEKKSFAVCGERIALCNVNGSFYAIEDRCTHDDSPFGMEQLEGAVIECPRHGARFDVTTGEVLCMPAVAPVATFPTRVRDGFIFVAIPGSGITQ